MRAYHFGNFYMSSIQQGIQAEHAAVWMAVKLRRSTDKKSQMFWDWAAFHETVILLNGGMDCDLKDIANFLNNPVSPYPFGMFKESKDAMDSMLTNVMVILPERIYDVAAQVRRRNLMFDNGGTMSLGRTEHMSNDDVEECNGMIIEYGHYSAFEMELIAKLNRYQLAS